MHGKVSLCNDLEFISLLMKQELVAVLMTSVQCKYHPELVFPQTVHANAAEVKESWAAIQGQRLVACVLRIH